MRLRETAATRGAIRLGLTCLVLVAGVAAAEQQARLGPYDVHYVVVRSTFFSAAIAEQYGIVRGRDRALMNISILEDDVPVAATVTGTVIDLLERRVSLDFREVREGSAVYYLAEIRHTDRETLRFRVSITGPDEVPRTLSFQQMMYWDGR